jgi:signal transduction histidine kinase
LIQPRLRMSLRVKFAAVFLLLLVIPTLLVSSFETNRTMGVMVGDLAGSGDLLINQTFEQIRAILQQSRGDPAAEIAASAPLRALLLASSAFGKGVVYVRVESPDGKVIAASDSGAPVNGLAQPQPFEDLRARALTWWPPSRIRSLWGERTYELSHEIQLDHKPFVVIRVGLSTALIAAEVRRSVEAIAAITGAAIIIALAGATLFGTILLSPLEEIAAGVERMAEGRDEVRLNIGGHDELSGLAEKFNQLSQVIRNNRNQWENERGQFFKIFRSITDAILLLDASGVLLFANPEALVRLGLPEGGAAEGKPVRTLFSADHPLRRLIEAAYATGAQTQDVAIELERRGEKVTLLVSILSLGQGPAPSGLLIIARDLEPVRQLENVVDYSGRLARLGGLISGVAHQIRNPLNAMGLQLELLTQDAAGGRSLDRRIAAVRNEIARLDHAVDALMRFMRPERLELAIISVPTLIGELLDQLAPAPKVQIERRIDPDLPVLRADHGLLGEALKNVINNAIEAMPDGGVIELSAKRTGNSTIEIAVTDHGGGIAPEILDKVCQLYFTTKPGGSGLGLALATRAVDLHGGTLRINSTVGIGTTVRIELPCEPILSVEQSASNR